MQIKFFQRHLGSVGILTLCFIYLGLQLAYHSYAKLSVDDFWFSHAAFRFRSQLPYRDFAPYKTVLGYYFLMLPTFFSQAGLQTLILTKHMIAVVNAGVMLVASLWLTRFFSQRAVCISLALLITCENVLTNSTNIRGDLLAYWFCLFGLLCLLDKKIFLAGLMIGLGFSTSQKVIWYIVGVNAALFLEFCLLSARKTTLKHILLFNLTTSLVILSYLAYWSFFADGRTVIDSVFKEASALYQLAWYESARLQFWSDIIRSNPLLFLLAPLTTVCFFVTYPQDYHYRERILSLGFAFVILVCLIPYKQIFPYYIQAAYPIFLILYAAALDWFFAIMQQHQHLQIKYIGRYGIIALCISHSAIIIYLYNLLRLPSAYMLTLMFPIGLAILLTRIVTTLQMRFYFRILAITFLFVGFVYPMIYFLTKLPLANGDYQRQNINTLSLLLQDKSDYVAGVDYFFNRSQPIAGMKHLMGPAIAYLHSPSAELRAVMLSSLDEDPSVTVDSIITALKNSQVKWYVHNYRMHYLPQKLQSFLREHYRHFWGSLYIYSPQIPAGRRTFHLTFSGQYRIETNAPFVQLNGRLYRAQAIYTLTQGDYMSRTGSTFRLILLPPRMLHLDSAYQADQWEKMI